MTSEKISSSFNYFIGLLREELESDEIEAWVDHLQLLRCEHGVVTLGGLNQFFCNYIKSHHQGYLREKVLEAFSDFGLDENFQLSIQSSAVPEPEVHPKATESEDLPKVYLEDGLNPNYHFESFVNGSNSDIAYAASQAVGENLAENKYNPLFLCGDVGLGKTHLLQAIGLQAREKDPKARIRYASSKEYINEVIEGIRFQKVGRVRDKYRNVDLLLIDDIQFLENKESTQEEFFHLFNELIQNKKQIVLTSDRYPREIKNLEERLVNRFNSGMVARIYAPDFETRVAIIRTKTEQKHLPLSEEIISYLAQAIKSNVRDIEGILIHIEANWSLLGQEISLETVKRVLREVMNIESNPRSIENIIKKVAAKFDVKVADLKSDKRTQEISKPRQVAMYIAREATDLSFPAIAEHFGGKNHTTVMQAHKKTKEWVEKDPEIRQTVLSIIREITG
ncbi:MAG: chromosomal replication initiator protein DnaA [bacterium]|nr:chromosomal replication initiator protein DnaA [bacterium]